MGAKEYGGMTRPWAATFALALVLCFTAGLVLSINGSVSAAGRSRRPWPPLPPMKPPILFHAPEQTPEVADPLDDYDALAYQISIRIDPPPLGDSTLSGTVEMQAKAINNLTSVDLDMGESLDADSAWTGPQLCPFTRPSAERVRIQLPAAVNPGDLFDVRIRYSGHPGPMCFPGMIFYGVHGADKFPVVSTSPLTVTEGGFFPSQNALGWKVAVAWVFGPRTFCP